MKKIIFSVVFVLGMLAGKSWAINLEPYYMAPYFVDGNYRTFVDERNLTDTSIVKEGVYSINGYQTKMAEVIQGQNIGRKVYRRGDDTGVYIAEMYLPNQNIGGYSANITYSYTPSALLLPSNMNIGQTVTSTVSERIYAVNKFNPYDTATWYYLYETELTLIGFEDVTIPDGTFPALKFKEIVTRSGTNNGLTENVKSSSTQWFISNVGFVKRNSIVSDGSTSNTYSILLVGTNIPFDTDGDAIIDDSDNCPTVSNPNQSDSDSDGIGNVCDSCPNDANNDADSDGICGDVDNCPNDANTDQTDSDSNGIGDACEVTVVPMLMLLLLNN